MDELTAERFLAPAPRTPEPPHPFALVLERRQVLIEAMRDVPRDPVTHRAPREVED